MAQDCLLKPLCPWHAKPAVAIVATAGCLAVAKIVPI